MNTGPTKILVVDDSALYRQSIHNVLREIEDALSVGVARNGVEAIEKIEELDPDLLTLDVQMPDMDGIRVLHEIKRRRLRAKAIMVSSFTAEGAEVTTNALMEGAFDFILKPSSSDSAANRQQLKDELGQKIHAFREASLGTFRNSESKRPVRVGVREANANHTGVAESAPAPTTVCRAVLIGTSTGGPVALKVVLSKLPLELPAPVLVVQHMPPKYTSSLAARLNETCALDVVEGSDGMKAVPGQVIIAPGGRQMKLERDRAGLAVRVIDDPPENGVRPSVDYLIRSAVETLDGDALAVILTGMGRDGLAGCRQLKQAGGFVFAQHRDGCVVYGMPKAVIEQELPSRILPLGKMAPAIVRHIKRSRRS